MTFMKRLSCSLFALLAIALAATAANFPYATFNQQTNRLSDNGAALTYNGVPLPTSTNYVSTTNTSPQTMAGALVFSPTPAGGEFIQLSPALFQTNGSAYSFNYLASPNTGGSRSNFVMQIGYNNLPSGGASNTLDGSLYLQWESFFDPGGVPTEMEWHLNAFTTNTPSVIRPIQFNVAVTNQAVDGFLRYDNLGFFDRATSTERFLMQNDKLYLLAQSYIIANVNNSAIYYATRAGGAGIVSGPWLDNLDRWQIAYEGLETDFGGNIKVSGSATAGSFDVPLLSLGDANTNLVVDFSTLGFRTANITNDTWISVQNMPSTVARTIEYVLYTGDTNRNVIWQTGLSNSMGAPLPAVLPSNNVVNLTLRSIGTTVTNVHAYVSWRIP